MSAIRANSQPPPSAWPLTAAMIGLRMFGIVDDQDAMKLVFVALLNVMSFISFMSAPAGGPKAVQKLNLSSHGIFVTYLRKPSHCQ